MECRLLGVLEVRANGVPLALGGPKQRSVLAMLLLDANRVVSTDRLVEGLWGDEPPLRAAATLQVYVSNLRKVLEPERAPRAESSVLRHQPPGYVLAVGPDQVDVFHFEHLVASARALSTAGCVAGAASLLREGLGLWRAAPIADLADEPFARSEVPRLEQARTGAIEDRIDADLVLGRHVELIPELEVLVGQHPFRERFRSQLMLALYRAGRQADALGAYQAARDALVEGLGLEPNQELRHLEAAILVQDPSLTPAPLTPITADEVTAVLTAINGDPPTPEVVVGVVEEGRVSARRAADALDRAIEQQRAAWFATTLASASSTRVELVRARHVIADEVLDRRRRRSHSATTPDRHELRNGASRELCPYRGLLPFEPEDAAWYFGREQLAADVLATVASTACTTVVGASGSGKSSLVRAGVVAPLRDGALPGSGKWPTLLMVPGADPVLELARVLAPVCHAASANQVRDRLLDEPEAISGFAARALEGRGRDAALVVVVDQLEELFTVCPDPALRDRFLDVLVGATHDAVAPMRIVAAVRADYFSRCVVHPEFAALVSAESVLVGPMSPSELQRAIELPAARSGLAIERGLVDRIVDDVGSEPGSLPLVETALLETWRARDESTLTIAGYERSGGVTGAVGQLADELYVHLSPEQQAIARGIFLRLAEPGEGLDDVRRRAPLAELLTDDEHAVVLAALVERRLVVTGDTSAEVAHEAILREWPLLRGWLEADREGRRVHRALSVAAQDWSEGGCDDALLFRGSRLAAATELDRTQPSLVNPLEQQFLEASLGAEQAELVEARKTSARFRRLTVGLAVFLVIAVAAAVFSLVQRSKAQHNANQAALQARVTDAARVTDTARTLARSDIGLASLLAVEGERLDPSPPNEGALQEVLTSAPQGLERVIPLEPPARYAQSSPDGRLLLAPGIDGIVRVLSIDTGRTVRSLHGPSPGAIVPHLSADGSRIIAGSVDGTIRVWNARSGRQVVKPFQVGGDGPAYATFDPTDRDALFVAAHDGTVARWSIADPHRPRADPEFRITEPEQSTVPYPVLLFVSPDGGTLAVGRATGGSTWLWNVPERHLVATLPGTASSFDDQAHAVTQDGGRVVRWDSATGAEIGSMDTNIGATNAIAATSADGKDVAVVDAATNAIHVLDADTGREVLDPIALRSDTPLLRFLPDGRLLVVSSDRAAVFRIDRSTPPVVAIELRTEGPGAASFSRDGRRVITWSNRTAVESWDPRTGARTSAPAGQPRDEEFQAVSPDGRTRFVLDRRARQSRLEDIAGRPLATLDLEFGRTWVWWNPDSKRMVSIVNEAASLWDVSDRHAPRKIADLAVAGKPDTSEKFLTTVAYTRDGKIMAVLHEAAGVVSLFDAHTGKRQAVLRLPRGTASAAAFSPDGSALAVTNSTFGDGRSGVQFFDVRSGRRTARLELTYEPASSVVGFVRGGSALLLSETVRAPTPSDPGETRLQLWDTATLRPIGDPFRLAAVPTSPLAASPDGTRVVHGTSSGETVVWNVSLRGWRRAACQIASRQLTRAEWSRYLPGRPYHPSCG